MRGEVCTVATKLELFIESCPSCGVEFGCPRDLHDRIVKSGGNMKLYCPNGHSITWRVSEADRLRRENERLLQNAAYLEDRRREAEREAEHQKKRANGYKGHATRITKRAKAGVCPCCNRSFENLRRHMETKHPAFTPMALEDAPLALAVIDGGKAA